jgi:hypothetical protein
MSSGSVYPALMCAADTIYAGSASFRGVHAAISGYRGWCDESGAMVIATAIAFLCETIVKRIIDAGNKYIGQALEETRAAVLAELNQD